MSDPRGVLRLTANDTEYRLHLGMSVLADVQLKHGQDALARLDPPEDAPESWMPPLEIVVDLFLGALQRHHAAEADRYLVDDILAQNQDALSGLIGATFPEQAQSGGKASGNGKRPKTAA